MFGARWVIPAWTQICMQGRRGIHAMSASGCVVFDLVQPGDPEDVTAVTRKVSRAPASACTGTQVGVCV